MTGADIPKLNKRSRLLRNFHKSFKPERQYINALLRFAAAGKEGDFHTIADEAGIPMGISSGKVPAILDYCQGMGLITLNDLAPSSIKRPTLTPFGRVVFLEDPYLKTSISQWIGHMNLCRPLYGADVWYHVFTRGASSLGARFERASLDSYLDLIYGSTNRSKIGPLIGMYEDEAAFSRCGVISDSGGVVTRKTAPIQEEYAIGYGAWLLQLIDENMPETDQITTQDLEKYTGWSAITGWDNNQQQRALDLIESTGVCSIDRHMQPWLIQAKSSPERAWRHIYDLLL